MATVCIVRREYDQTDVADEDWVLIHEISSQELNNVLQPKDNVTTRKLTFLEALLKSAECDSLQHSNGKESQMSRAPASTQQRMQHEPEVSRTQNSFSHGNTLNI